VTGAWKFGCRLWALPVRHRQNSKNPSQPLFWIHSQPSNLVRATAKRVLMPNSLMLTAAAHVNHVRRHEVVVSKLTMHAC